MNEKRKFKFNILDVILILFIIASIVGAAFRYSLPEKVGISIGTGNDTAIVKFYVSNIRTDVAKDSFVENDLYYIDSFKSNFGYLYNVEGFIYEPHKVYCEDEDGLIKLDTVDHRCDVTGYFKVTGTFDEKNGFLLDGVNKLYIGNNYEVYSINRRMSIMIAAIEKVES